MDKEANIDVLLAIDGDASNAQGWIVDDGDEEVEPEFESEDELVEENNFEFESDEEEALERYGEEQDKLDT
ncbi:hypothetical protein LWI28_002141 [Acer negundo]|uniref:Uncharacterized protein n=1 Tax=Acer negundo TaxID=4023 RepID=A0AAD5JC08_ACENE|nr:hypothetical protein LWI28_002141 [Acer negundo]